MKKNIKILIGILAAIGFLTHMAAAYSAPDLMRIGTGARPLGMGKAYVAIAEDADTIFMNPSGLAGINSFKLTSMYSSFMGDANYLVIGGAYPVANGGVGAGVISSGVNDIPLYDALGYSNGSGSWQNSVMFLSYGSDLTRSYSLPINGQLYAGANLKFFTAGGHGTSTIENSTGNGMDMDVAMLYMPANAEWLSLGLNAQNILPSSMGGKYTSGYGIEEGIPANAKVGAKIALLGKEKSLRTADQKLNLAVDLDIPITEKVPGVSHYGLEYWPNSNLALRVGMDGNPSGSGAYNNVTAGLGVRMAGMEFNYAYHPYGDIGSDATHYFSVGYVGMAEAKNEISLLSPADKTIVYEDKIKVEGTAISSIKQVMVNGIAADLKNGKFSLMVPVEKFGKKVITVQGLKQAGKPAEENIRILRLASYVDVGPNYWAKNPIERTGTIGLVQGYPDGTFRPGRALTRAELAILIVRAKGIPIATVAQNQKIFKDLSGKHWAAGYIKSAQDSGYVKGYPDGKFKPNQIITKAEGIAVMARVDGIDKKVIATASAPYSDVPANFWASQSIASARSAGYLDYVRGPALGPMDKLSRAEAVEMMSKTGFASAEIQKLLSWFVGYQKEVPPKEGGGPRGAIDPDRRSQERSDGEGGNFPQRTLLSSSL